MDQYRRDGIVDVYAGLKGSYVETHTGFESLTFRHKLFNEEEYLLYLFVVFFLFLPLTIVEGNESNLVILQAKEIISLEHEERFSKCNRY